MSARPRPTIRLRRLADTLRRLRTDHGLSRGEVAKLTGVNTATLYRIEAARVRPQGRTLAALFALYEVAEDERRALTRLLTESGRVEWLQAYADVLSEQYCAAIEYEDEAHAVRSFDPLRFPDLLQTQAYARAAITGALPGLSRDAVERHVAARVRRQAVLTRRRQPLRLWAVCDEAALHRLVGGPKVMREQLLHVVETAKLPNVTLQLVPFRTGAYPGPPGSFAVMELPDGANAVYVDSGAGGDRILMEEPDVRRCADLFARMWEVALHPAASVERIAAHANSVPAAEGAC